MTYLYNPKANPKRYGLYALCAACVGAGAACFLFTSTLVAVFATTAGIWAAGSILKAYLKVQSARIVTYDEGFTAYTSDGSKYAFIWDEITHAGIVVSGEYEGTVFAYAEGSDKIVQLPPVFVNFESFIAELKQKSPWQEYELAEGETITARLKMILGITDAAPEEEAEETDSLLEEASESTVDSDSEKPDTI